MATEVVEVATESKEDVVINCVAIFYDEGKERGEFQKKRIIEWTSMYVQFQYLGKNLMLFAVFWCISVWFCGFWTPLTPPSLPNILVAGVLFLFLLSQKSHYVGQKECKKNSFNITCCFVTHFQYFKAQIRIRGELENLWNQVIFSRDPALK